MSKKKLIIIWIAGLLLITGGVSIYRIDYIKSNPLPNRYEKQREDLVEVMKHNQCSDDAVIKMVLENDANIRKLLIRNTIKFAFIISFAFVIIAGLLSYSLRDQRKRGDS
ncbi:MAG: hypothetical protein KJ915_03195 [Candidatus Omnitrophica bacterium]|nr:hypothetical protein [Candidatus Omnitrophota bacterium]